MVVENIRKHRAPACASIGILPAHRGKSMRQFAWRCYPEPLRNPTQLARRKKPLAKCVHAGKADIDRPAA